MGFIEKRRNGKLYLRYIEGYRPAVDENGDPKLYESGKKKGQPKVDADGKPLMEPIERTRLAEGCTTKEQAKKMLAEIERNLMEGKLGIEPPDLQAQARKTITVGELAEKFLKEYNNPKRIKNIAKYRVESRYVLDKRILPTLKDRPAASIDAHDVEKLRNQLTDDDYAGSSVKTTLACLSKMYVWARRAKYIDCANPCSGVDRPNAKSSVDFLSKKEVEKLLAYAVQHATEWYAMIAFCVYTGCRKGEAFGLKWSHVNFDGNRIDVMHSYNDTPKSGKTRHLPLHPSLAPILRWWKQQAPANDSDLVFAVSGRMGRADETYGLEKILWAAKCHLPENGKPWHMLRHTFASHFVMCGGTIQSLQKLLGHADIKETLRYSHLSPDFMAAEVARMSFPESIAGVVVDLGEARRKREGDGTTTVRTDTTDDADTTK